MKLLFLDIDGCLNSYRSNLVLRKEKIASNLDPIAVMLIQKIVKETGCIICLSSDWRLFHDYMQLGKELDLPILFETDHVKFDEEEKRADLIKKVVKELKPDKYVIIDDEEFQREFEGEPWVNIANEDGFSYKDYLLAIEYLKD